MKVNCKYVYTYNGYVSEGFVFMPKTFLFTVTEETVDRYKIVLTDGTQDEIMKNSMMSKNAKPVE